MEFSRLEGVARTVVGYTGGKQPNPSYSNILDSTEAVLIEYDPAVVSYQTLLKEWAKLHNPKYEMRTQYRSVLWVKNKEERKAALEQIEIMRNEKHRFYRPSSKNKLFIDVEDQVGPFYQAEEYHQDYMLKHTGGTGFF